jgi:hypothetical protein
VTVAEEIAGVVPDAVAGSSRGRRMRDKRLVWLFWCMIRLFA